MGQAATCESFREAAPEPAYSLNSQLRWRTRKMQRSPRSNGSVFRSGCLEISLSRMSDAASTVRATPTHHLNRTILLLLRRCLLAESFRSMVGAGTGLHLDMQRTRMSGEADTMPRILACLLSNMTTGGTSSKRTIGPQRCVGEIRKTV